MSVPLEVASIPEDLVVPYDRELYRHWIDVDGDCQDARQEVLIAESLIPVTMDEGDCEVEAGRWFDPYTGQTFTDPGQLHIDHMIPLREAHLSSADAWTAETRRAFANDLAFSASLIAVADWVNMSKGARDPAVWLPPNESYRCDYVRTWLAVKARWDLEIDPDEAQAIDCILAGCQ